MLQNVNLRNDDVTQNVSAVFDYGCGGFVAGTFDAEDVHCCNYTIFFFISLFLLFSFVFLSPFPFIHLVLTSPSHALSSSRWTASHLKESKTVQPKRISSSDNVWEGEVRRGEGEVKKEWKKKGEQKLKEGDERKRIEGEEKVIHPTEKP